MSQQPQLGTARNVTRPAKRRRRGPGWVPNHHGAWAMLIVPFVVGVLNAGPDWRHIPLLFALCAGYLAFFATGLWLRSRCKGRYWPPVRAYGAIAAVLGMVIIVIEPELLWWSLAFLPLLAVSLWSSWQRTDRSLLNDGVTVLFACLMTVVVAGVGEPARQGSAALAGVAWLPGADQAHAWVLAGLLFAYFAGTVLYVKSMIRNRGDRGMYLLSVGYHVAVCVPAFIAGPWIGWFFVVLAIRAAAVPRWWPKLTPAMLGVGEIVASLIITVLLLLI